MDVKKSCSAVIGRVIFIGFGVQIVLGILWMCNAFAGMHGFGEGIVCVGQMALLGCGIWFVLCGKAVTEKVTTEKVTTGKTTDGKNKVVKDMVGKLFMVMAVLSFPMVLQSLMKPDLRVLVAFFLLLGLRFCRMAARPGRILLAVSVVLAVGMIAGTASERDLLALSGSRLVWTTLYQDYDELTEEENEKVDYTAMVESTYEVTGVENILIPTLRQTLPEEEVQVILKRLISIAWHGHKGQIIKEILWDEAGHLLPALVVPMQLAHRAYDSRTGLNYRQFLQPAPLLGRYAMRYGCAWFAAALVLRGILWMLAEGRVKDRKAFCYAVVTAIVLSFWYTFSTAGRMDYRNVIYILCLWLLWMTDIRPEGQREGMTDGGKTQK